MRKKILTYIDDGYTVDEISDELDISRAVVDEVIRSLLREDYLSDYNCEDCSSCPFSCSDPDLTEVNAYILTEKGMDLMVESEEL